MIKFLTPLLILLSTNSIAATCYISHKCGIPVINMTWGPAPGEYGKLVEVNNNEDCVNRAFDYLKEFQPNGKCVAIKAMKPPIMRAAKGR